MVKNTALYLFAGIIKVIISLLITLPIITFYLSAEQIGLYVYVVLLSNLWMMPIGAGGHMIAASHYIQANELERRTMFFHLYVIEYLIKILLFIALYLFGDFFLKFFFHEFKNEYMTYILFFSASLIFTATKPILYYFFTIERRGGKYFFYNILEILLNLFFIILFLYILNYGLIGYFLAALCTSIVTFTFEIGSMYKYFEISINTNYIKTIYHKGVKLFYANFIEQISNIYDSYIVQKFLNFHQLGIYSHAKQYIGNFGLIDKSFFYSYSAGYMRMLNNEENLNIFKITFIWYSFLLFSGIGIIFFADDVVSYLTHDKLTQSADLLSILYILIFFRSNQQQYTCQLLFYKKNEAYTNLAVAANILAFLILTIGVFIYHAGLHFIVFSYVLNVILRNIFIKGYAIFKYKIVDISELIFIISLSIYILLLVISRNTHV